MKKYLSFILYSVLILSGTFTYAQTTPTSAPTTNREYTVLAPLPGTTKNCTTDGCTADLNSYLSGFLGLAIGVGAMIAMIILAYYGFQYSLSDSASVKMQHKDKIFEILGGFLLIVSAYAIVRTINPKILPADGFNIDISTPITQGGSVGTATSTGATGGVNEVQTRQQLTGISINANPCAANQTRGCTNVADLPTYAVGALVNLKSTCNCDLMITGGTEGGHATHGPGKAKVDLRPSTSLNTYLGYSNPKEGDRVTKNINGRIIRFTYEETGGNASGTSTGNHWHVDIN